MPAQKNSDIWDYAKVYGFAIVSKDFNFYFRSLVLGRPLKVIWLRLGNCSTSEIESFLQSARSSILEFENQEVETCLILTPK